MSISLYM